MPPPPFYNIRYRPEDPECDCDGIFTGTLFGQSHTFRHYEDCYKRLDIILDVANPKVQVIKDCGIIIFCEYVGEMQSPEERKAAAQKLRLPPVEVSRVDTSEEQEESPAKEQETQDPQCLLAENIQSEGKLQPLSNGFLEQCSESDDSISNQKVEKQADSEDLDKASAVHSTESEKLVLAVSSLKQELTKAEPSNASETPSLVSHYLPISPESSDHTGSSLLLDLEVSDSEDESEISSSNPSSVILSKENSMTSSSSVPSLTLPDGDEPVSNPSEELPSGAFSGLSVNLGEENVPGMFSCEDSAEGVLDVQMITEDLAGMHFLAQLSQRKTEDGEMVFACRKCKQTFQTSHCRYNHEKRKHGSEPTACVWCGEQLDTEMHRRYHACPAFTNTHSNNCTVPKSTPECALCLLQFRNNYNLKRHETSIRHQENLKLARKSVVQDHSYTGGRRIPSADLEENTKKKKPSPKKKMVAPKLRKVPDFKSQYTRIMLGKSEVSINSTGDKVKNVQEGNLVKSPNKSEQPLNTKPKPSIRIALKPQNEVATRNKPRKSFIFISRKCSPKVGCGASTSARSKLKSETTETENQRSEDRHSSDTETGVIGYNGPMPESERKVEAVSVRERILASKCESQTESETERKPEKEKQDDHHEESDSDSDRISLKYELPNYESFKNICVGGSEYTSLDILKPLTEDVATSKKHESSAKSASKVVWPEQTSKFAESAGSPDGSVESSGQSPRFKSVTASSQRNSENATIKQAKPPKEKEAVVDFNPVSDPSAEGHQQPKRKIHKCEVCGKMFPRGYDLNHHKSTHHKKRSHYPCGQCSMVFSDIKELYIHLASGHLLERLQCQLCGRFFLLKSDLEEHLVLHNSPTAFHCTKCPQVFRKKQYLVRHIEHHNQGYEHNFVRKVNPNTEEQKHEQFCTSGANCGDVKSSGENYWCSICNQKFCCQKDVHSHIAKSHMLKNSRDKKSENHKVRGTKNNKIKLYRCSICNLESAWKKNIGRHNQGKHGGQAKIIKRAKEEHDAPSYIDQEEQTQVSTLGGKNERKEEDEGCKVELETFATDRLKEQDPVSELPCDNTEEGQDHENVAVDTDSQNVTFKLYCKETAEEQTESRERKRSSSQSEYGEVKKSPKRERKRKRAREDGEDVTRPKSTNSIDTREEISLDGWTIIRYNT